MMQLKDPSLLRQQAYLNGQWCNADNGETCSVTNPATGEIIGTVPKMGTEETRRAIAAADSAWPEWRAKTGKERSAILRKWNDLMLANADDLAMIMTVEQGKPLAEAKGEIAYAASFIEWFAEEAKRVNGDTLQSPWSGPPYRCHQTAHRRMRGHNTLEFPGCDDYPQSWSGTGCWLPMVFKPRWPHRTQDWL